MQSSEIFYQQQMQPFQCHLMRLPDVCLSVCLSAHRLSCAFPNSTTKSTRMPNIDVKLPVSRVTLEPVLSQGHDQARLLPVRGPRPLPACGPRIPLPLPLPFPLFLSPPSPTFPHLHLPLPSPPLPPFMSRPVTSS